jgi:hypothetical protein
MPEEIQNWLKARGFGKDPDVRICIDAPLLKRKKKDQAG